MNSEFLKSRAADFCGLNLANMHGKKFLESILDRYLWQPETSKFLDDVTSLNQRESPEFYMLCIDYLEFYLEVIYMKAKLSRYHHVENTDNFLDNLEKFPIFRYISEF